MEDKNTEIENLEKEFNIKLNRIKENYKNNFESEELEERSIIYKNEMIGNIRVQIEDVMNPPNNKKVEFNFDIK